MLKQIRGRVHELTAVPITDILITERERLDYQSNNLYDVKFGNHHWIAKEFVKEDEFLDAPRREYNALKLLENFDLAPQAIDYMPYPDFEHPVVVYEYMVGDMWNRRKPSQEELQRLAETWLITHQARREGLWLSRGWEMPFDEKIKRHHRFYQVYFDWAETYYPQAIPHVKRAFTLYDTHRDILQKLKDAQVTLFFSRSDPRFANIIARPNNQIGFVDWEDSGLRSPARTIADLLTHPNQEDLLSISEWQIFLDSYCDNYPAKLDDVRQLVHWDMLLRSLTWFGGLLNLGVRRAEQNTLAGWHINGMEANLRLRRYLARALSWEDDSFEVELANPGDLQFFP